MLRVVASRRIVNHLWTGRHNAAARLAVTNGVRCFSNKDKEPNAFADMLNKLKSKPSEEKKEEDAANKEQGEQATAEQAEQKQEPKKEEVDYAKLVSNAMDATKRATSSFMTGLQGAWKELITPEQKSKIRVPVQQAAPSEVDENYDGPRAMVLVDQPKSVWESMQDRLGSSPFIREMLKNSRKMQDAAAQTDVGKTAKKVSDEFRNRIEDAREVWETSQNPLIYSLSSVVDSLTSHTEESLAIKSIQAVEKDFNKEEWSKDVLENLAPMIMRAHLEGDLATLRMWLGEACYNKFKADVQTRKFDGIIVDSNILHVEEQQAVYKILEGEGPIIICVYHTQQINHIRKKDGTVIEGGPNEVIARIYSVVYKPVYEEPTETEPGYIVWKIIDMEMGGGDAYY